MVKYLKRFNVWLKDTGDLLEAPNRVISIAFLSTWRHFSERQLDFVSIL